MAPCGNPALEPSTSVVVVAGTTSLLLIFPSWKWIWWFHFSAGVVIEAGDECLDGEVWEMVKPCTLAPLMVTALVVACAPGYGPSAASVTGRLDGSPAVAFQRIVELGSAAHAALLLAGAVASLVPAATLTVMSGRAA
ncbi:MAG: hypothetical protein ACLU9S_20470 [Oscillospiraceae bacterium]